VGPSTVKSGTNLFWALESAHQVPGRGSLYTAKKLNKDIQCLSSHSWCAVSGWSEEEGRQKALSAAFSRAAQAKNFLAAGAASEEQSFVVAGRRNRCPALKVHFALCGGLDRSSLVGP